MFLQINRPLVLLWQQKGRGEHTDMHAFLPSEGLQELLHKDNAPKRRIGALHLQKGPPPSSH